MPLDQPNAAAEMPFLDHLEELRWRIMKMLLALIVAFMVSMTLCMNVDVIWWIAPSAPVHGHFPSYLMDVGAVLGVGAAWLFAAHVSDGMIRLVVGLIALGFVGYAFVTRGRPPASKRPHAALGIGWGGLAGFTSTLIQIGGPPYYAFVLPQRLEKMLYVGTTVWFFALVNTMKVAPYFGLGQFSTAGLATSAVLFPLAIASNFLGVWLVRVTPEALFYKITNVIVFLLGVELTRQGLVELLWR